MRFDISAYKVGTSCGPSVIHKLDFDNPKVYGDTSIFDGLGKYWIGAFQLPRVIIYESVQLVLFVIADTRRSAS